MILKDSHNDSCCLWCGTAPGEGSITVTGYEENDGTYCSSDCLFHQLLSDRTNEDTFAKVQEIINFK